MFGFPGICERCSVLVFEHGGGMIEERFKTILWFKNVYMKPNKPSFIAICSEISERTIKLKRLGTFFIIVFIVSYYIHGKFKSHIIMMIIYTISKQKQYLRLKSKYDIESG